MTFEMDSTNLLEDIGSNVNIKIEAESDSVFFGLNSTMATPNLQSTLLQNDYDMTSQDCQDAMNDHSFLANDIADLDFDLLQDLPLPVDDFSMLDEILMNDDSRSNSFSSESYGLDTVADSPPLTPPSPTCSSSSSSSSNPGPRLEIKLEQVLSPNPENGADVMNNIHQLTQNIKPLRGRSASHEAPEVQALKRHIRMIRNRESACMSRKKKKDYVTGVENRVKELEAENLQLKQENVALKKRLQELGQGIAVPPRVLTPAAQVKAKSTVAVNTRPKILKINAKLPATAAKIVLLGFCCFMFVTFGPPTSDVNNANNSNSTHPMSKILINSEAMIPNNFLPSMSGKSSLSYESERHIDQDDTLPSYIKGQRKRGLWDNIRVDETYMEKNESSLNGTLSGTGNKSTPTVNTIHHRKLSKSGTGNTISLENPSEHFQGRLKYANETLDKMENCALFNQTEALKVQNRLKGIFGKRPAQPRKKAAHRPIVYSLIDSSTKISDNKGLTVYDEKIRRYSKMFDQLERREDTYYVISLDVENQILFSAKAPNNTARPKMSFLLPWRNETRGGKEELMQIDCEVTGVFALNKPARGA